MTVSELRKELVQKIGKIENNELLEEMYRLVKTGMLKDKPKNGLSHSVKKNVNGKNKQVEKDDSMDDDIDMWLRNMAF